MLPELDDYDWEEAFGYAGEPGTFGGPVLQRAVPESPVSLSPFAREDVAEIVAASPGEDDDSEWMIYGRLHDGRWFYLEAGCDYTGWDCQAGGSATLAVSREECERFALTEGARRRLNVTLEST